MISSWITSAQLLPAEGEWVVGIWRNGDIVKCKRDGVHWLTFDHDECPEPVMWVHIPKFN